MERFLHFNDQSDGDMRPIKTYRKEMGKGEKGRGGNARKMGSEGEWKDIREWDEGKGEENREKGVEGEMGT